MTWSITCSRITGGILWCRGPERPAMMKRSVDIIGKRKEGGFFTIWILGLCVMLLAMGGVSIDLWRGFTERREVAAITDAAAIAGASQIDLDTFKNSGKAQLNPQAAKQTALAYIAQQSAQSKITFTKAPAVQVTQTQINITASTKIDLTLMKIFRPNGTLEITTHSSASPQEAQ